MTSKMLLSTLATAALLFGAPAFSADGKEEHPTCDPAGKKDCRDGKDGHAHDEKQ